MDTLILLTLFAVIIIGFTIVVVMMNRRLNDMKQSGTVEMMKGDVTELSRTIGLLQQSMGDKIERSNEAMQTSMQKQLGASARLVADVTQRLAKLDETNRRVVDVADELKTLQNVLQNPKQRGVFGEYYLES
ncbi:MAG: DNA recombination protein RmuC, partial [Candidatus Saccharimonadales bacterium]